MRRIAILLLPLLVVVACSSKRRTPPPTVASVAPQIGPIVGGTAMTVTGTQFRAGVTVDVDGVAATNVVLVDAMMVTCTTPAGTSPGAKDVTVKTSGGSDTLAGAFTYYPAPTVAAVAPPDGSILGGTAVTVTGTDFQANLTVDVDGVAATNVVIVDPMTVTCTTPAGMSPGAKDVTVTTPAGSDTLAGAYTYFPPPALMAVATDRAGEAGGRTITLTGTGFQANGATGTNSVTIDGAPATGLLEVDDTTLTCVTPAGTPGAVDVVVSNANGMATLVGGFTYVTPMLYAVTARSGSTSQPGILYSIDPATGAGTMIGATGDVMTGIAFDPTFTTMFGINTSPFAAQSIFTVDVTTGMTTLVGATGTPPSNNVGDLTFVGSMLVGNSYVGEFCSFDTTTGAATLIGNNGSTFQGLAIAADVEQTLYFSYGSRTLYTVDPANGALTTIAALSGDIGGSEILFAMTFLDGVLHAVAAEPGTATARLVTIDPATAVVTLVGDMPDRIDSLEGNVR